MPVGRELHIDTPLSNLSVAAFARSGVYVGQQVFPIVSVGKQSDLYYTLDKDTWMRVHNTVRAPKSKARRIEFKVSSDSYFAKNYALGADNALEDLDNADTAIMLRETGVEQVVDGLLKDYELRCATKAINGASSVQRLTGANAWDAVSSADIVGQVRDAKLGIFNRTGLTPNSIVLDYQSYEYARQNERAFERFKYVEGGFLSDTQLKSLWGVDNIFLSKAIYNSATEGATAARRSIWGPTALVCYINPVRGLKVATFGASFRWTPAGFSAPMAVTRQVFAGAGTENIEVLESQYFQDEKVLASDLGHYINTKSGAAW